MPGPISSLGTRSMFSARRLRFVQAAEGTAEAALLEPGLERVRRVIARDPFMQGPALRALPRKFEKFLQPALVALGPVQIGPAGELRLGPAPRAPAARVDQI